MNSIKGYIALSILSVVMLLSIYSALRMAHRVEIWESVAQNLIKAFVNASDLHKCHMDASLLNIKLTECDKFSKQRIEDYLYLNNLWIKYNYNYIWKQDEKIK